MAQSDIHYSNSMHEEQDAGNPDPIKMFKNLLGSRSGGGGGGGATKKKDDDEVDLEAAAAADRASARDAGPEGAAGATSASASVLASAGLKPNSTIRILQERSQRMTPEERATAEAHAQKMQAMLDAKMASMPPAARAQLQAKQESLTKAVMAQMHAETVAGATSGESQPRLLPAARRAMPAPPPEETPEQARDREVLFAIRSGNVDALKEHLATHAIDVNASVQAPNDAEPHPLLHWAALNDQKEVIDFLVDQSVDLDQKNSRGEVALHWASLNGNLRSVHLLVDAGCDRMASDARGYSAMHHAAQFGRTVVLACLLRRGLHVEIRDNNGRTPLHWAAYKGEDRCAQWLLEHGADVAAQDFEQCLPIHWAALQGLASMSSVLVKHGALPYLDRKDRTGGTPAALARDKQNRYEAETPQHKTFARVADYLEACVKQGKDVRKKPVQLRHPTWYAWPVLSAIGFWQYWTRVMDATYYYPLVTLVFWLSLMLTWAFWLRLQLKNPGTFVLRDAKSVQAFRARLKGAGGNDEKAILDNDSCACPVNPAQKHAQEYRDHYLEALDKGLLVPLCTTCEIAKPIRSKHDKYTDVCVARFDHFCPFLGVAVGGNNYFEFFFTMLCALVCTWLWLYMSILYTMAYNPTHSFVANFWDLILWELYVWVLYLPLAIYAVLMVGQHALFIKANITTNEVMNRFRYQYLAKKQNPFDRGPMGNVLEFLGLLDSREMDLRNYYNIEFAGRSLQVEENNLRLRNPELAPPPVPPQSSCCSNSHSHSHGGGHGHSHGH